MQNITPGQLQSKLESGDKPFLLDVREDWECDICSIEGSVNISMEKVNQMLKQLNPELETVVICHHGMRSLQVANFLENNGFTNIINLQGGIDAWAKDIDPNMAQY